MTTLSQDQAAVRSAARSRIRPAWLPQHWYAHIVLWIACIIVAFPLFYAMLAATQTNSELYRYQFTPGSAFWDNWNTVMNLAHLPTYMLNSALIAVTVTVGKVILSLLAGLAFVYFRFPGKWLVFGFVLVTLMM